MDCNGKNEFFHAFPVSRETQAKLELFAELVLQHGQIQNLIAASTMTALWSRHILDSAQVATLASPLARRWVDVGSGAGLPGLVLAILSDAEHILVEPRKLRVDFLRLAITELELQDRVTVAQSDVHRVILDDVDLITARAFTSLVKTINATQHLAGPATVWLLHKGKNAAAEVAELQKVWEGDILLTPSVTDPLGAIVTLSQLRRRKSH